MDMKNTWEELSPTYGKFIYYSRTATTHDGSLPTNAGQGLQTDIVGPLRRVDSKGKVKEFEPPLEDAAMLSRNIACEVLQSIKAMLIEKGADIPSPSHADLIDHLEASINSDNFIPHFVKQMMLENRDEISSSPSAANFNYARDTLSAIETVRKRFELPIK
ncbi:hypothetical protein [Pseudoduganella sp. R-43]|uniref:hypothetical protein n=1 Tax=unclassified Pseudoduganella TaxID=2637179 RepID=UPI003CF18D14